MKRLQQQLKVVHDELTHLMAEAKMDSLSRSKLASASNQLLEISQQIEAEISAQSVPKANPKAKLAVVKRAMEFLAWVAREFLMKRYDDDGS
jgi:4'-phosphopantetheinyl transferase EntD